MRPRPPEILIDEEYVGIVYMLPAPELDAWIRKTFLDDSSPLYNEEHIHLTRADFRSMWTNVPNVKGQMRVAATAEMPFMRGSAWSKARQEVQMQEWFGGIPTFLLTFDAVLAVEADDLQFTARVEHELYHCAHARDEFGAPKFNDAGQPKFTMKGHDVEEHTGIMRRYGPHGCAGDTIAFLEAAQRMPEIGEVEILGVCGTCGR
jgi:hypothetical protein